jgi:hypothetical protein
MFSRSILGRGSLYLKPSPLLSASRVASASASASASFHHSTRFSFAAAQPAMANTSGVTPDSLKETLTTKLGAEHVEIEDLSGTVLFFPRSTLSLYLSLLDN